MINTHQKLAGRPRVYSNLPNITVNWTDGGYNYFRSVFSGGETCDFLVFPGVYTGFNAGMGQTVFKQSSDQDGSQPEAAAISCDCVAKCKTCLSTAISYKCKGAGLNSAFADINYNFEALNTFLTLLLSHFINDEKNSVHFFPVNLELKK